MEDLSLPKPPEVPSEKKDDDKDKKAKKKKSTDSKDFGSLALGRKEKQKDKDSLFGSLGGTEKKDDESRPEQIDKLSEAPKELSESQLHGELAPEEIVEVQRDILQAHETIDNSISGETEDDVEQIAGEDVSDYRQRALQADPETAFVEKLADMGVKPPEDLVAEEAEELEPIEASHDEPQDFSEEEIPILRTEAEPNEPTPPIAASAGGGAGGPPHRPPNPLLPRATPMGPGGGSGYYTVNAMAGGGRPGATFRPEYVPVRDETLLGILPGGIVGYLMGRRRGRIKTEKKLLPVQKKLEKQVKTLEEDITQKEEYIRKVSRQHARERIARQPLVSAAEKPVKEQAALAMAEVRKPAPEAHQLHGKAPSLEKIGHVLIEAEAARAIGSASEKVATRVEEQPAARKAEVADITERQVETMSRTELLSLSEKIVVDGSSLRQIYETRLVGEKGMRRLVQEYLGNGDIKKALRREIMEREVDFERDPVLRDNAPHAGLNAGGTATTLKELLRKADATDFDDSEEVAFLKARAAYEAEEQTKQQRQRKLIDVSLTTTIIILAVAVTILILEH